MKKSSRKSLITRVARIWKQAPYTEIKFGLNSNIDTNVGIEEFQPTDCAEWATFVGNVDGTNSSGLLGTAGAKPFITWVSYIRRSTAHFEHALLIEELWH
ncbi:hypothetical protein GCK32_013768 [Trichostrongylus colubriformis]|uniref:Uncharacterized protein n=1 Tax=Trichostrongylus colubriformis TaxID=6319 RepID=A0AAN8FP32_TRICO